MSRQYDDKKSVWKRLSAWLESFSDLDGGAHDDYSRRLSQIEDRLSKLETRPASSSG